MTTIQHLKGSFSEPITLRHRLLALKRAELLDWVSMLGMPLFLSVMFGAILLAMGSPNPFLGACLGGLSGFVVSGHLLVRFLRGNVDVGPDVYLFGYHRKGAICCPAFFPSGGVHDAFLLSTVKMSPAPVPWSFELSVDPSTRVAGFVLIEFVFRQHWDPLSIERLLGRSYEDVSIVVLKELRVALKGLELQALLSLTNEAVTEQLQPGVTNAPEFNDTGLEIKVSVREFSVMHRTPAVATKRASCARSGDDDSLTSAAGS